MSGLIPTLVNPKDVEKTIAALEAKEPWRRLLGDRYIARPLGDNKMTIYLELAYVRGKTGYALEGSKREPCRICLKMARIKKVVGKLNSILTKRLKIEEQQFKADPVNIAEAREQALIRIEKYTKYVNHLKTGNVKQKLAKQKAQKKLDDKVASLDDILADILNREWWTQRFNLAKTLSTARRIEHLKDLYRGLFKLHPQCVGCGILFGEYHCDSSQKTPLGNACGSCATVYKKYGLAKFKKFVERGKRYGYGAY